MSMPIALVLGDLSLVRSLGIAGIPVAVTHPRSDHASHSRYVVESIPIPIRLNDGTTDHELLDTITAWGKKRRHKPVLFYQDDADLFFVSRNRHALSENFSFIAPPGQLVESLTRKSSFHFLAERFRLPTPKTTVLSSHAVVRRHQIRSWNSFPMVLKPCHRSAWTDNPLRDLQGGQNKALFFQKRDDLMKAQDTILSNGAGALLQQAIPGTERDIVSYHAYVRRDGSIAGDFTGRKLRTFPVRFGHSSYLIATHDQQLRRAGSQILKAIGFDGVAKLDFKRDPRTGRDFLLEINPRFNLWHHLGATFGVNLPAMVYSDLTGAQAQPTGVDLFRPNRWMALRRDYRAVSSESPSMGKWAHWGLQVMMAEVNEDLCLHDPMPAIHDMTGWMERRLSKIVPSGDWFRHLFPAFSPHS